MKELYRLLGIEAATSTAYHPQTDGQMEQVNQKLEQYLRITLTKQHKHSRVDSNKRYNISAGTRLKDVIKRRTTVTCSSLIKVKVQCGF